MVLCHALDLLKIRSPVSFSVGANALRERWRYYGLQLLKTTRSFE
jgi:hypothetical protein